MLLQICVSLAEVDLSLQLWVDSEDLKGSLCTTFCPSFFAFESFFPISTCAGLLLGASPPCVCLYVLTAFGKMADVKLDLGDMSPMGESKSKSIRTGLMGDESIFKRSATKLLPCLLFTAPPCSRTPQEGGRLWAERQRVRRGQWLHMHLLRAVRNDQRLIQSKKGNIQYRIFTDSAPSNNPSKQSLVVSPSGKVVMLQFPTIMVQEWHHLPLSWPPFQKGCLTWHLSSFILRGLIFLFRCSVHFLKGDATISTPDVSAASFLPF